MGREGAAQVALTRLLLDSIAVRIVGGSALMAHIVAEPCFDCKYTDCVVVCPVDCFYEGAQMLFIHPDECLDCGACEAECPVAAIFFEEELPAKWHDFAALNKLYFKDKTAVRLELDKRYPS